MGLLDYFDPDALRGKLKGLLGGMPISQIARGDADVSREGLRAALMGIPVFDPKSGAQDAFNAGLGALTFAGVGAKTADKAALARAQKMAESGADRGAIWSETGWFKGPDNKWRFEIDDKKAGIKGRWPEDGFDTSPNKIGYTKNENDPIADSFRHEDLFSAYPDAKGINYWARYEYGPDTRFHKDPSGAVVEGSGGGYFSPSKNEISSNAFGQSRGTARSGIKSSTLHELQHYIQGEEGFASGGDPRQFLNGGPINPKTGQQFSIEEALGEYRRLAGEAEARATQARMNFDAAKRKQIPPWESYDIPWDQLVVKY